jgi:UDP-glucose 4-epimerase
MRVLVTGGLGFLGRAVTKELATHGHEVLILSHTIALNTFRDMPIIHADLRDKLVLAEALRPHGIQAVCHLAALTSVRDSWLDPLDYFETNVAGTLNLLRALGSNVRVVMTSTSAVYGSARPGRLDENLPTEPENPYAASKVAAEQVLRYAADTGTIGAVVLRCFNLSGSVDGYGDPDQTRIIPNTMRAAAKEIPHVTVNGDGSAVREFTHVLDAAEAIRLALDFSELGTHRTFNVGTGNGVSMMDVIHRAEGVTGQRIRVVHRPVAAEAHTLISDPARASEDLGWRPRLSSLDRILSDAWLATRRPMSNE